MNPILQSYLDAQLASGFPCHRGSRINGRIVATERIVNRDFMSGVAAGKLSIRCSEKGMVELVAFNALPAISAEIVDVDSDLTLTMRVSTFGRALAWTYQTFIGSPYFFAAGGRIYVKVGSIPEIAAWRHVWKDRFRSQITTLSGKLVIEFTFDIN